jgi:hypothetical protein
MHLLSLATVAICLSLLGQAAAADISDAEIRRLLIQRSIASYPGNCPCPYSVDRASRSCGKRSAYSKQGGYAPLCYPSDVTDEMVAKHRSAT